MFGENQHQLFSLFKMAQDTREDSYSTSLPYYMLTGRKGCKVYSEGEASVVVAKHPHVDNKMLVFPALNGNGDLTVQILNRLASKGVDVQLARYTDDDFVVLQEALDRDVVSVIDSIQLTPEDILDWKYPAHIIDTAKVSALEGKEFRALRKVFNRFSALEDFEITSLHEPDGIKKMRASILIWSGLMIYAGKENGHDMREFYDTLVKHIIAFPQMFDGFIINHQGEPAGFTIWDNMGGKTMTALASLSRRSIDNMSEFQLIETCRRLSVQGIGRLNLGGSETSELDRFKLKFRPIDSINLSSYNVNFNLFGSQSISEISIVP